MTALNKLLELVKHQSVSLDLSEGAFDGRMEALAERLVPSLWLFSVLLLNGY